MENADFANAVTMESHFSVNSSVKAPDGIKYYYDGSIGPDVLLQCDLSNSVKAVVNKVEKLTITSTSVTVTGPLVVQANGSETVEINSNAELIGVDAIKGGDSGPLQLYPGTGGGSVNIQSENQTTEVIVANAEVKVKVSNADKLTVTSASVTVTGPLNVSGGKISISPSFIGSTAITDPVFVGTVNSTNFTKYAKTCSSITRPVYIINNTNTDPLKKITLSQKHSGSIFSIKNESTVAPLVVVFPDIEGMEIYLEIRGGSTGNNLILESSVSKFRIPVQFTFFDQTLSLDQNEYTQIKFTNANPGNLHAYTTHYLHNGTNWTSVGIGHRFSSSTA
jgi:phage baseplate assembly protein gpV